MQSRANKHAIKERTIINCQHPTVRGNKMLRKGPLVQQPPGRLSLLQSWHGIQKTKKELSSDKINWKRYQVPEASGSV